MKYNVLFFIFIVCVIVYIVMPIERTKLDIKIAENISKKEYLAFKTDYDEFKRQNYYDGEKISDIANKLNRYFNSSLEGMGEFIAKYSLEVGVNPYLSSSVILLETGCQWTCSYISRECNNFGGNKGKPGCNGGSYKRFSSKNEGLKFAINTLANYYKKGLTTPEQIGPKYASSNTWATKVNNYMNKLKSNQF